MQLKSIIFLRTALLLAVMTILVSGFYIVFSIHHYRQNTTELWGTRATVLCNGLRQLVLWDDRLAVRKLLLDEVRGSAVLDYAFVVKEGNPYVSTFDRGVPVALLKRPMVEVERDVWEFRQTDGQVMYDLMTLVDQEGTVLHLGLNREAIDRELHPLIIANLVVSLGVIAAGCLLAVVLARRTTREVDVLAQALHEYGEVGEQQEQNIDATSAEVTELVSSFKRLSAERRRAEQEILTLNAELEQRVRDRTAQLTAVNQELDAFAYSVSHDLRAPLRGIDGFSLALLEDYGDRLNEEGKHYLTRIRSGCVRMGRLIDDLLHLSRITRGEIVRKPIDLSALARQVVEELQHAEPGRKVAFSCDAEVVASADPKLIRAVLDNLLGNAWKFTSRVKQATIAFGRCEIEGETVYFITDNGAGFDMQYANKLFGAFQRLHKTAEFEGSGIGLATVQRVIQRHGGRVWAQGEVGVGATFYFTLGDGGLDEG